MICRRKAVVGIIISVLLAVSARAFRPCPKQGRSNDDLSIKRMAAYSRSEPVEVFVLGSTTTTTTALQHFFPRTDPPYLALITERCSCDSDERVAAALEALRAAVSTGLVDLVSVHVNIIPDQKDFNKAMPLNEARLVKMVKQLVEWSHGINSSSSSCSNATTTAIHPFRVVVSSDWMEVGIRAGAHGVHFKETHRELIPEARKLYQELHHISDSDSELLVGTSTHTVDSAVAAWKLYQPDYFFAGTCFETESHPEKSGDDLEGPAFPAQVCQALDDMELLPSSLLRRPAVLAIGGLDASNCREQVIRGSFVPDSNADGIATIRAVLQAGDPAEAVRSIKRNMKVSVL